MANRIDTIIRAAAPACYVGMGTLYVVETPAGVIYHFYIDASTNDPSFCKSTDGGLSWSNATSLGAVTATQMSIWYDRWSGINADLVHVAYAESAADDVSYCNVNLASSDAVSATTVIFAGISTATGCALSITRARGGNIGVAFNIDAWAEHGFSTSVDVGANWVAKTDTTEATTDQYILLPGWAADNQDLMMFFWDASADEISRKLFDNSANSWGETSIATTMVDYPAAAASVGYPNFAATVDITNSRNVLVAWSAKDAANADLRCWYITEAAITEVTNVVLNSTDDQGYCAIAIDVSTNYWYVFYGGKSDGSEDHPSAINIYYKVSKDYGSAWGPETKITNRTYSIYTINCTPLYYKNWQMQFLFLTGYSYLTTSVNLIIPRTTFQLGI